MIADRRYRFSILLQRQQTLQQIPQQLSSGEVNNWFSIILLTGFEAPVILP